MAGFNIDPWEAARVIYEGKMLRWMMVMMKAAGLKELRVSPLVIISADDILQSTEEMDGTKVYRLVEKDAENENF